MQNKTCSNCKIIKPLASFGKNKRHRDGLSYICRDCVKIENKKYQETYPWIICFMNIRARCNNKNNENYKWYGEKGIDCLITKDEVRILWFRDKAWLMKKPSINRKDSNKDYIFDNCYFDEQSNNSIEANKRTKIKPILQFDKNGNFIKEWNSITEASKSYNTTVQNISFALHNQHYFACGYNWKLKKK